MKKQSRKDGRSSSLHGNYYAVDVAEVDLCYVVVLTFKCWFNYTREDDAPPSALMLLLSSFWWQWWWQLLMMTDAQKMRRSQTFSHNDVISYKKQNRIGIEWQFPLSVVSFSRVTQIRKYCTRKCIHVFRCVDVYSNFETPLFFESSVRKAFTFWTVHSSRKTKWSKRQDTAMPPLCW